MIWSIRDKFDPPIVDFFHNLKCNTRPTSREIFQSCCLYYHVLLKKQLPSGISPITLIRELAFSFRAVDHVLCGSSVNCVFELDDRDKLSKLLRPDYLQNFVTSNVRVISLFNHLTSMKRSFINAASILAYCVCIVIFQGQGNAYI